MPLQALLWDVGGATRRTTKASSLMPARSRPASLRAHAALSHIRLVAADHAADDVRVEQVAHLLAVCDMSGLQDASRLGA